MMTPSNLTLQALLDKRRELDAQINVLTSKRNEAIQSVLKVMHNFAITIEDLREAQAQNGQSEQAQAPSSAIAAQTPSSTDQPQPKRSAKTVKGVRKTAKKAAKKTARRTSKSADMSGNEDRSITTPEPLSSPSALHIAPSLSDDLEMEIEPPTSIMDEQPVAQEESTAAHSEPISRPIREYSYSEPFDDENEEEDEDPNSIPQDIA